MTTADFPIRYTPEAWRAIHGTAKPYPWPYKKLHLFVDPMLPRGWAVEHRADGTTSIGVTL